MMSVFSRNLTDKKIDKIKQRAIKASKNGQLELTWEIIQPLMKGLESNETVAFCLIELVNEDCFTIENSLEILETVFKHHKNNTAIVSKIGSSSEYARDIDYLNLAPSDSPLFQSVVDTLSKALNQAKDLEQEEEILDGLSTAARMMARQHDEIVERSYKRLVEIKPEYSSYRYSYGLFCKTRGFFKEGMLANQKAVSLVEEPVDSYQWNLGICATGAGEGEIALQIWKGMGNKIKMGRFGLPEGRYPSCKVRLAQYPLAERTAENDDPGIEETIWIERLSPCHGIIRSVLYYDLGVDYGDVILMDGAPVTYHTYGDKEIAVFPHLTTLVHSNYQFYDFAAIQKEKSQIDGISSSLSGDAIVYSHSENFRILCSICWKDSSIDHENHETEEKNIIIGRIAAPHEMKSEELMSQIDAAIEDLDGCSIYAPELCERAGLDKRAKVEQRRYNLLVEN
jgi:hypothetical protein